MFLPKDPYTSQPDHLEATTNVPLLTYENHQTIEHGCKCHMEEHNKSPTNLEWTPNIVEYITIQEKYTKDIQGFLIMYKIENTTIL